MEQFVKHIFKLMNIGTEAKKLVSSIDRFVRENYVVLEKVMSEKEVSVRDFLELYDVRTYDIRSKQNDIKYMKELDFKGLYLIKNLTKKSYYLGYGDRVFRKVDRHFRGYGNQDIFSDFKKKDVFVVCFERFDSTKYDGIEDYEKESRVYIKSRMEGYQYYGSVPEKQTTKKQETVNNKRDTDMNKPNNNGVLKKKRLKAFLFSRKRIMLNVSAAELIGKLYGDVIKILTENGFTNIVEVPVRDIYIDNCYALGTVDNVMIDGSNMFEQGEMFPYDVRIEVLFHLKKKIPFPFSQRQVKNQNCEVIFNELKNVGFIGIRTIAINDLITGWIVKVNSIEKVVIYKQERYKKGQLLDYDTEIDIYYHTFK